VGHWKVYLTIKKGDKLIISSNNETDADAEKDMFLKNGVAYHRLLAPSMTNFARITIAFPCSVHFERQT